MVIAANSRRQLKFVGCRALKILNNWTTSHSLSISMEKTKVLLMFKTAKLKRSPYFSLGGNRISSVKVHKILGLTIDSNLTWVHHARTLSRLLHDLAFKLLSISRTGWGVSGQNMKTWYLTVAERIIVYAAPVWAYKLNSHTIRILRSIQRSFAIRSTRANRHVSADAVLQLAGLVPIELVLYKEYILGSLFRLKSQVTVNNMVYSPSMVDLPESRWFIAPYEFTVLKRIILENQDLPVNYLSYFTNGSKSEDGVGSAFCVFRADLCIHTWKFKLKNHNTFSRLRLLPFYRH